MGWSIGSRCLALGVLALMIGACGEGTGVQDAPSDVSLAIDDAPRGGEPQFHWLPPVVTSTQYTGVFDPGASVSLSVHEMLPAGGTREVAQFVTGGPPGGRIVAEQHIESYIAQWRTTQCVTGPCRLEPNRVYRIFAFVRPPSTAGPSFLAGFADAFLVRTPAALAEVDRSQYVGVVNGGALSIRFRIEAGMVGAVQVQPDAATLAVGQQLTLGATVVDVRGNPMQTTPLWSSASPAVASVSASGVVTGLTPGLALVFARVGARRDSLFVTVSGAANEVPPTPLLPLSGVMVLQDNPANLCQPDPVTGHGFAMVFNWSAASGPKPIAGYDVQVANGISGTELIRVELPGLALSAQQCQQRISNTELDGWAWRVRARYTDQSYGPWSSAETFTFLPADFSTTFVFDPPDYGAGKTQVSLSGAVDAITSGSAVFTTRTTTSAAVFMPPNVFFHRSEHAPFDAYYRTIGPWTAITIFDQGATRIWRQSMTWDPSAPVVPLVTPVVATIVGPFSSPLVSNRVLVAVVP